MSIDITKINKRETIKLWAILHGKYDDFVRAYSSDDNNLRRYWETMIEPEVQRECGEHWGENPRLPLHPIGYALLEKNGLLPNQQQKKEDNERPALPSTVYGRGCTRTTQQPDQRDYEPRT